MVIFNIYHSKKNQVVFFLLNRNLYFGRCATKLKQQDDKTVYLTQQVDKIRICFIVFVVIMPC